MRARRPFVRHDREPPPAYVAIVGAESRPALRSAVRRHDTVGHHIWQSPEQDIYIYRSANIYMAEVVDLGAEPSPPKRRAESKAAGKKAARAKDCERAEHDV